MTLKAKVANALSFAHQAGLGRSKAAKAEEDEDKKKDDAKKADDESDEAKAKAAAEDDEKKKDDEEKSKATKAEKDDDSDDDVDKEKAAASAERARCKAIVAHGVKTDQIVHACAYAFDTDMSVEAAVATMDANLALHKPAGSSLADRMSAVKTPVVQPEGEQAAADSPKAIADMIIAAAAKASGAKA